VGLYLKGEEEVEIIQELLDAGFSRNKIAEKLGLEHKTIGRLVEKYELEIYVAYDEIDDRRHLYQNFEWLWEEDKLEEITEKVIKEGFCDLPKPGDRNSDDFKVSKYCKEVYGDLKTYLLMKGYSLISNCIIVECVICKENRSIDDYEFHGSRYFGLDSRCRKCMTNIKREWAVDNKEKISAALHRRRARLKKLPSDFFESDIVNLLTLFNDGCALTGDLPIHLDHVIPLSTGHGGTINGNMIPLRADLNFSKNDSNIFEWFEAIRQRFELSQERFDNLIAWLASANAMTVEEYRDFVYWCHANPRNIDELEAQ
jgi:hypothetical protein